MPWRCSSSSCAATTRRSLLAIGDLGCVGSRLGAVVGTARRVGLEALGDRPSMERIEPCALILSAGDQLIEVALMSRPVGRQAPKGGPQLALDAHRSYQSLELDQDAQ